MSQHQYKKLILLTLLYTQRGRAVQQRSVSGLSLDTVELECPVRASKGHCLVGGARLFALAFISKES